MPRLPEVCVICKAETLPCSGKFSWGSNFPDSRSLPFHGFNLHGCEHSRPLCTVQIKLIFVGLIFAVRQSSAKIGPSKISCCTVCKEWELDCPLAWQRLMHQVPSAVVQRMRFSSSLSILWIHSLWDKETGNPRCSVILAVWYDSNGWSRELHVYISNHLVHEASW